MAKPSLKPYRRTGSIYRWRIYYDDTEGKRRERLFRTKKEADACLLDKQIDLQKHGETVAATLTPEVKGDAFEAHKLLAGFGVTLEEAAAHYARHLRATTKSAPIVDLVTEFLDSKKSRSKRHRDGLRINLERFAKDFAARYAAEVTTPEIETWLTALDVSDMTRNHYRDKLHAFFSWCKRKGRTADNPVTAIEKAEVLPGKCEIYTAAEMRKLLHTATTWSPARIKPMGKRKKRNCRELAHETSDILANILLCGFAGLRQSTFERLTWEMVKLERSKIDLPPEITKKRKRNLVTIQPVLAAWLMAHFPDRKGTVVKTNFPNRLAAFRRHMKEAHALTWKQNGLRHSFASYLLEQTQNAGHVALELGHRGGVGVLLDHYAERVSKDDTTAFWALTPEVAAKPVADVVPFEAQSA